MPFTAGSKLRAAELSELLDSGTDAQYNAAATQSIANVTQTVVAFATANRTSSLVTRSVQGAGHRFTVSRAGIWAVTMTIRYAFAAVSGERYVLLNSSAGGLGSQGMVVPATNGPFTACIGATTYLAAGSWLQGEVYQSTGGARDLEFNNVTGWGRIQMAWVHA